MSILMSHAMLVVSTSCLMSISSYHSSGLAKQPRGDVAHVRLLQLVVLTPHLVNPDILKRGNNRLDVKAHRDEAVDKVLVVAVVPAGVSNAPHIINRLTLPA
jgi:hypothetical protein